MFLVSTKNYFSRERSFYKVLAKLLTVFFFIVYLAFNPAKTQAAIYEVDPDFGVDGVFTWDDGTSDGYNFIKGVVNTEDGYILVGTNNIGGDPYLTLLKTDKNGQIDTDWGSSGVKTLSSFSVYVSKVQQVDDNFWVIGHYRTGTTPFPTIILKYNLDGELDLSFGEGSGYAFPQSCLTSPGLYLPTSFMIVGDKIYTLNREYDASWVANTSVVRMSMDGTQSSDDLNFAFTIDKDSSHNSPFAFEVTEDKIYVLTSIGRWPEAALHRYNIDGTLDTSFGDGSCRDPFGEGGFGCYIYSNPGDDVIFPAMYLDEDAIYIFGSIGDAPTNRNNAALWKLSLEGFPDTDWGTNGVVETSRPDIDDITHSQPRSIMKLQDGSFLISETPAFYTGTDWDFVSLVTKVDKYGSVDQNYFNSKGYDMTPWYHSTAAGSDGYFFQDQNSILVTGMINQGGSHDFWVKKYRYFYQIAGLQDNVKATQDGTPIKLDDLYGGYGEDDLVLLSKNDVPVAEVSVDLRQDLDFATVSMGTDSQNSRSYIHGLGSVTGYNGSTNIFVPKPEKHTAVAVCPSAENINAVNKSCDGLYVLSSSDPEVSVVTIDYKDYWVVSGLPGSGGFSIEDTDALVDKALPETGSSILMIYAGVVLILASSIMGLCIRFNEDFRVIRVLKR
ncbi:hypothetical protein GF357_01490 [Candidatus Dojkabacteria bacterium]|nr:hypothetical protein [Candidatus Dojkabacteria bacterium]